MSKHQTRKSISINGALFRRAKEFVGTRMPMAQLAEQALEAVLGPPLTKRDRMLATDEETGVDRGRPRVIAGHPEPPAPPLRLDLRLKPFCASCTGPTVLDPTDNRCAMLQPLGRNGALVTICHDCRTLPAEDDRYDLGHAGGARPGLAEGARWSSAKGVGK
jgi:hypothetical protein